ncbi:hypothetical protein D3C71_392980 [compost metagenome]
MNGPGQRLFVLDLIGAMAFARGARLRFGQSAPAAGEPRKQGIKAQPRGFQHVLVGAARSVGRDRRGLAGLLKDGGAAEVAAGPPQARGGRKKRFQERKHGSAPVIGVVVGDTDDPARGGCARAAAGRGFRSESRRSAAYRRAQAPGQMLPVSGSRRWRAGVRKTEGELAEESEPGQASHRVRARPGIRGCGVRQDRDGYPAGRLAVRRQVRQACRRRARGAIEVRGLRH